MTSGVETSEPGYARGAALVLTAGVFFSFGALAIRLMPTAGEWQVVFYRSIFLVPTLLALIYLRRRGAVLAAFRAIGVAGLLAAAFITAGFTQFVFAVNHTTVATALFLLSAAPFIGALLGWLFLRERVDRVTWAAIAAATVGVALMVGDGLDAGRLWGNLAALGTACAYAAFTVALRWRRGVDMLPAVCLGGIFAVLFAGLAVGLTGRELAITPIDLGLCAFLGVIQVGVGLTLLIAGSRHVPVAQLNLLALTEVVLGPVWVWLVLGELPGGMTALGGAIVLTAVAGQALAGARTQSAGLPG